MEEREQSPRACGCLCPAGCRGCGAAVAPAQGAPRNPGPSAPAGALRGTGTAAAPSRGAACCRPASGTRVRGKKDMAPQRRSAVPPGVRGGTATAHGRSQMLFMVFRASVNATGPTQCENWCIIFNTSINGTAERSPQRPQKS